MSLYSLPSVRDKLICAALYSSIFLPMDVGLVVNFLPIVIIIYANIKKIYLKDFIKYHCYQAILFNMLVNFLPQLLSLLINFLTTLLSLFVIFNNSIVLIQSFTSWFINIYFIFIKVVAVYAIIWTTRGRYTYMPPLSQAVNLLLR